MRYVVVLPEQPWPPTSGGRIANRHLCDGLIEMGHDVTVVAVDTTGRVTGVPWPLVRCDPRPDTWRAWVPWRARLAWERTGNPFALERAAEIGRSVTAAVERQEPDVVVNNHTYGWWPTPRPQVLFAQNIETHRLRTAGVGGRKLRAVVAFERAALSGADEVAVLSDLDRRRAEELVPSCRPVVVPLGVAPSRPRREGQPDRLRSVAFVGSFEYRPNRDAAAFLAARAPALLADGVERIVIAGRAAGSLPDAVRGTTGVDIHSDVEDMERLFRAQDLLVVPLLNGGGVRVKVLEAWALGVPVVSTAVGIEGLGATHGVEALVAENAEDLVALVAEAADPALRTSIADAGWRRWHEHFTPAVFAARVHQLATKSRPPAARPAVPSHTGS